MDLLLPVWWVADECWLELTLMSCADQTMDLKLWSIAFWKNEIQIKNRFKPLWFKSIQAHFIHSFIKLVPGIKWGLLLQGFEGQKNKRTESFFVYLCCEFYCIKSDWRNNNNTLKKKQSFAFKCVLYMNKIVIRIISSTLNRDSD